MKSLETRNFIAYTVQKIKVADSYPVIPSSVSIGRLDPDPQYECGTGSRSRRS
jgi:hypothetical protein